MDSLGTTLLKWRFASCVFEESSLELSVAGAQVELERKPLEVLRYLLRHAGEVVTKEEIQSAVWPGRVLSDTVLTKAVSRIREVLGDDAQTLVKTVHGYGYRLIAPVSIEPATHQAVPVLGLKAGDCPSLRPQWRLEQHLGSGGSGEVWKVIHAKTGDVRVFKFAVDAAALDSLKREITLFRLLRQQLGPDAPIAEILDWNLEEAPYFLELSHYSSGNLAAWASAQGGLALIPLAQRLKVFAAVAAAVAAVHGVGVLHKDIKAGNILMIGEGGAVRPLLADFGGAGVLADDVIANAGITRMGFSQPHHAAGHATTLYIAPEVLEGQPQTVRGDVYALGVLLYQLCVADFRKPVATGWEQNIADELLCADIAEAVQGNPEQRLSSAQALADRILSLDQRHVALASQRRDEAERKAAAEDVLTARRKLDAMHTRRKALIVMLLLLGAGLGASLLLYREAVIARQQAEQARAVAETVSDFLNYDVLAATEQEGRDTRSLTAQQLLDDAAKKIDTRFKNQPEAGAKIHSALSSSYMQIGDTAAAIVHRSRGWDIARELQATQPEASLRLAVDLSPVDFTRDEDYDYWLQMRDQALVHFGARDERTLLLRNAVALGDSRRRYPEQAAAAYADIVRDAEQIDDYDVETLATHWEDLGQEHASLARFTEAEAAYRKALALYEKLHGPGSFSAATASIRYARLLTTLARYAEAETQLDGALKASRAQRNSHNALVIASQRWLAVLRIAQGRLPEAESLADAVLQAEIASRGEISQQVVHAGYLLALVREQQGRHAEAEKRIRDTLIAQDKVPLVLLSGERRRSAERVGYQLLLVRVLAAQGLAAEARSVFDTLSKGALQASYLSDLDQADGLRSEGLLMACEGDVEAARIKFKQALQIRVSRLGVAHPQARQLAEELAALQLRPT